MDEILFRGFHPCENGEATIYVYGKAFIGRWVEGFLTTGKKILFSCLYLYRQKRLKKSKTKKATNVMTLFLTLKRFSPPPSANIQA